MLFKSGTPLYSYEIVRESGNQVMYINYLGAAFVPSIIENAEIMNRTMDLLIEAPNISRIVFVQQRNYNYDSAQVFMLQEIAGLYVFLTKQEKILSPFKLSISNSQYLSQRYNDVGYLLMTLKRDPIACFVELERFLREENLNLESTPKRLKTDKLSYIRILEKFHGLLSNTTLIKEAKKYLRNYSFEDRNIYYHFFRPDIIPNFTFTRLASGLPEGAEIIDQYEIGEVFDKSVVTILKREQDAKHLYHLMPPEYSLDEEKQTLLNLARNVLIEHQPKAEEFTDPEKTRQVFFNVSRDLLRELGESRNIKLSYNELNNLARILVRHTIGFGLIEVLLQDKKIQDIVLNAPISTNPIYLRHSEFDECMTNIVPSREDADSWAAKFRMISARPLDESNPILDTDLNLGLVRARVAVIQQPLSPGGLAYALRRHREDPWTLPLFVKNRMINSFSAGLLSFLIDGSRTILVAGTRSAGKCVDGNSLIQLANGEITKIKDLMGDEKRKIEDGIIFNSKSPAEGISLDSFSIEPKKITDVWRRKSPEKVIRIKTKSGKEIITTFEHPYFIYKEGIKNKRADELKKGELIATPRKINIFGFDQVIDLTKYNEVFKESNDYYYLKGKTNSKIFKFPKNVTPEFAEFLGMVMGDGHLDNCKLEFTNNSKDLRKRYISLIRSLFGVSFREFRSRNTFNVQICNRILNRVLRDIFEIPFGKKSGKIIIPKLILKSNKSILSKFLRGYFDCDGYISKSKREIELVTASKEMSEHLRLALLRFGITCFTKTKKINGVYYYRNFIRGKFVDSYIGNIGFFHPVKKRRAEEISIIEHLDNTNVDVIPQGNEILRKLRSILRVTPKELRTTGKDYWAIENRQYRTTRKWFKELIGFYKKRYEFLGSKKNQIKMMEDFVNFDYENYLEKIERIRKLLRFSYAGFALEMGISEKGLRNILHNKRISNFETIEKFLNLMDKINNRFLEIYTFKNLNLNIGDIPLLVNKGIVSYAEISRECQIPESTFRYNCQNGFFNFSEDKIVLIKSKLSEIKENILRSVSECSILLNQILSYNHTLKSINFGILLSEFRYILNMANEEFIKEGASIGTVTNFFNGSYEPNFLTLKKIVKTIVGIYNSCVSDDVSRLILESENLANSDIFWDEVVFVETVNKIDDYVYDLTIEGTHNFVANGLIAHNTSLLGSLLLEVMPKFRIIVIEDTLELPVESLRKLNYDILRMKVRSSLLKTTNEIGADEGIRTSLRLGDSCLIVGEVRSLEAKALYEAMRVGALANVVAGTIHGASPYGVFDRVVNDLEVPVTSFKATDCILVANPVKTSDGLRSMKRVIQIAEVRKHWTKDPEEEGGFVDLLKYNVEKDELEASEELINGDSEVIKAIASNVKGWAGDWDAVYDNILLRAKIKQELVDFSKKVNMPNLLESKFNSLSNNLFHEFSKKVQEEIGLPEGKRVFKLWQDWLKEQVRGKTI